MQTHQQQKDIPQLNRTFHYIVEINLKKYQRVLLQNCLQENIKLISVPTQYILANVPTTKKILENEFRLFQRSFFSKSLYGQYLQSKNSTTKFEGSYLDNSKTQLFSLLFCTVLIIILANDIIPFLQATGCRLEGEKKMWYLDNL